MYIMSVYTFAPIMNKIKILEAMDKTRRTTIATLFP